MGLDVDRMVTGAELSQLSPEEFSKTVEESNVFVKLSPAQKEQIVKALRNNGHVVGFMGDGINDAPALKAADVGISVDSAVDVAKESADIVLLEKSLLVLEEGIMEGRRVFANIVKYIRMGASSNFGNMFSVVGASYLLPFLPMRPVQILTNNLLYDFSQTGIPTDNVDEELISKAPQMGHRQHQAVHGLHRADQLHLRLRHLRPDVVLLPLQCLSAIPRRARCKRGHWRSSFRRDGSWNRC